MNLGDMVMIGTAPKVATARKLLSFDPMQSLIARKLYGVKDAKGFKNYSTGRALASAPRNLLDYQE
jgi:hypothetical protein